MDTTATTRLTFDASGARQGADEFVRASQKIIAANQAVVDSENRKLAAIKAAATATSEAVRKAASELNTGAAAATSPINAPYQTRAENRGLRVAGAALQAAPAVPSFAERTAALSAGQGVAETASAIAPAAIAPLVSNAFGAIRAGDSQVARGVRNIALTERNDPATTNILGELRNAGAKSAMPSGGGGIGQAAGLGGSIAASAARDDGTALTGAIVQLSIAIDKLNLRLTAETAPARQAAAESQVPAGAVARRADTAARADSPWVVEPAVPRDIAAAQRQAQGQFALAERAAYGSTTATHAAFVTPASISSLGSGQSIASGALARLPAATNTGLPTAAGVDAAAWLKARQPPNEVDAAAWNKARQGPESFLASLKNLFLGASSGVGDLHAVTEATEGLATASGHAHGAAGRMREGLVLVRELFRGDLTRAVGSVTIELQRFGLLGAIFNPVTLAIGATAGAIGYLAYKASEIEANLRSFGSTVKVMGDGSLTSAAELEKFTEQLKHTGVAGEDAKKSIQDIARSGFVRPGQSTADFALLARDIAQYSGAGAKGTPAATEELLHAFSGGTEEALKFAESLHALSGPQIAAIHDLDQHARSGEALAKIYEVLRAKIPPFTGDLSEIGKAFLDIKTAWDDFTTSLAKGNFPSLLTDAVKGLLSELRADIQSIEDIVNFIHRTKAAVTGEATSPGGIRRDQIAPQYGPGSGNLEPYAAAPLPPGTAAATKVVPTQQEVGNYLTTALRFTPSQSAAVIGQAQQESSLNPAAGLGTAHQGMFQLDKERFAQLQAFAQQNGLDPMDYRTQLQFAKGEIQTKAPNFFSATSLGDQTSILTKQFEVSGNYDTEIPKRLARSEQALGTTTTPFRATEGQSAQVDIENQKLKDRLAISSQLAGGEREAAQERQRLQELASKALPTSSQADRDKFVDDQMLGFWQNLATLFGTQHRLNEIEAADTQKIGAAFGQTIAQGYRYQALVQAQAEIRAHGGAPSEIPIAQEDILTRNAVGAIKTGKERLALAQPAIEQQQQLAAAALLGRDAENKARIVAEAAAQTQDALNQALGKGNLEYIAAARNLDTQTQAQIRAKEAAAANIAVAHEIQGQRDESEILNKQISLQGLGTQELQRQIGYLRIQQDLRKEPLLSASPQVRTSFVDEAQQGIELTKTLEEAQLQTARLNEAFENIASTISGELTNALRNALIRTPVEAGEHIKNYWRDFRAGLKDTLASIESTIVNTAFIKPLTGTIAGALGLGQTAQQLGTFATGGAMTVSGGGGTDSEHVHFMASPGERVYILTPAQQADAAKTGTMPHFADGGMLDVGGSWSAGDAWSSGDPEAAGMAQASTAMQPAIGAIGTAVGQEASAFGQAGVGLARAGLETNAEFYAGKETGGPLLGFRPDTGELTGRLPALAEQVTGGMTGPVALSEIGAGEHAAEAFEHLHESEETIGSTNTGLRFGRAVAGVRGADVAAPEGVGEQAQGENYGIDVFGALGRGAAAVLSQFAPLDTRAIGHGALPMFVGGGEYDPFAGEVVNYSSGDLPFPATSNALGSGIGAPASSGIFNALSKPGMNTPSGNVPLSAPERSFDGVGGYSQDFGKPFVSNSSIVQGLGSLNVESPASAMQPMMGAFLHNMEIRQPVIGPVPIDMMHMLGGQQLAPQMLLHDPSVLKKLLPADSNPSVPAVVQSANEIPPVFAFSAAEGSSGFDVSSGSKETAAAGSADQGYLHSDNAIAQIPALQQGGTIEKTGIALVHQGEVVLSTATADNALQGFATGLKGVAGALGQATPHLQELARTSTALSEAMTALKSASTLFSPETGGKLAGAPSAVATVNPGRSFLGGSGNQVTVQASGLASGAGIFSATNGGNVIAPGNVLTVQGASQAVAGGGAVAASTGTAGLSADQLQALLNAGTTPLGAAPQTSGAAPIEAFLGAITSAAATGAAQPVATTTATTTLPTIDVIANAAAPVTGESLAPQQAAPATATQAALEGAPGTAAVAPASTTSPLSLGTGLQGAGLLNSIAGGAGGTGSLSDFLGFSNLTSAGSGIFSTINNFGAANLGFGATNVTTGDVTGATAGEFSSSVPGSLFGTTTLGEAIGGVGSGFAAGQLLNTLLGGNQLTGSVGSAGGAVAGTLLGSLLLPGLGTLLAGIVGGAGGGALGGLLGPGPAGQSAGTQINAQTGQQNAQDIGGSAANISTSGQVSSQISSFIQSLNQLTNAQGQPIGAINPGNIVVSSNNTQGIRVNSNVQGVAGGSFDQNAAGAVTETELQLIQSLQNVGTTLQTAISHITDPSQLQAAVHFSDVYDKLNVTEAQLTANLNGNVDAIGPFQTALVSINSTFSQLTASANQFGVSAAPISAALKTVTDTLNRDFSISLDAALSTAIDGGNNFIATLLQVHQAFVQNTTDAATLAANNANPGAQITTTPAAAAGSTSTPPGQILVGEEGPEWMLPRGGGANDWVQVGKSGPELINQPGGAVILPNPMTPAAAFMGGASIGGISSISFDPTRSFAAGTDPLGTAGNVATLGSAASGAVGGPTLPGIVDIANAIAPEATSAVTGVSIAGSTLGAVAGAVGVGSAAGSLLNLALGGNSTNASIGSTGGSIAGTLIGSLLGGPLIGGLIGGILGGLGGLIGPKPSNNASGDEVDLASGTIQGFITAGDKNADQIVEQISAGISAVSTTFQAATGGSISGAVSVQDGKRDGIKTSYSGPLGQVDAKWGSVEDAIGQFALAIAHGLTGIAPALQAQLANISDPNALIPAIEQYTGASIDLNSGKVTFPAPVSATATTGAPVVAPPPPPPPTLSQMYDSVIAGDPTNFNNTTGLQNKATLLNLLTAYAALSPTMQRSYNTVLGGDPADFNNSIAGLQNKTSLVNLLAAYAALSPDEQTKYDATIATDPGTWNNTPAGLQNKLSLVAFEAGATGAPSPTTATPTVDSIVAQYNALPAYAAGTGNAMTPPGWILVGEKGPEWLNQAGGATVLPTGTMPPGNVSPAGRSFAAGTDPITSGLDLAQANATIAGIESAQAGPTLAGLGIDQLATVIQDLAQTAPEIAAMAQNLVSSGNALPDILTQGIQALTDPLDIAVEKEKAAGQERVQVATATGQDLTKVEQLNTSSIISAIVTNLSSPQALAGLQYANNTKALQTISAAPALAGLSGDQLTALISDISGVAPDLAALAQQQISGGTALPDTVTQALQAIVNPLQLALEQQGAQATSRTQIAAATGQYQPQTAALNTASVAQAIISQLGNQQSLLALTAGGNPQGLAALQAAPALASLGVDQLAKVASDIGTAAPQLTDMINALLQSGKALPDALTQASEAITQSGLLAVQKAQALAFEQYQAAQASGQNLPQAQQLGAAEQAQAVAQATGTQIPLFGLPDFGTQLEEAVVNPLQLAVQKAQALGQQEVQIAQQTGTDLVQVQQATSASIQQIWYQATSSLTDLKNQITTGTLSGLIPSQQVSASLEQFNQLLTLVQSGNTNFIGQLSSAGQAAVQASQQAYGQGPQTASVRQQILGAISPFLVSATGYPTTGATALNAPATSPTATGTTTDLQANTTALGALTDAITGAASGTGSGTSGGTGGTVPPAAAGATGLTAAPATGPGMPAVAAQGSGGGTGFTPDLTASLPNLLGQYGALSPTLQGDYNSVVGADNADFNNQAGLQNKVDLASLLTGYQSLTSTQQTQYGAEIAGNTAAYNNTPAGISNKLSLVQSISGPPASAPATAAPGAALTTPLTTSAATTAGITTNPVTGAAFTGSGITAITPNFPIYPSASTLSNALSDAIGGVGSAADYTAINQAVQAGILNAAETPQYASAITAAAQYAAGQTVAPSQPLAQALSDALTGTPTLTEWATIITAVNAGLINPVSNPQYATVIQRARIIANAQATSLSAAPNTNTAFQTTYKGLPAFAAGSMATPPGAILVGEHGPEIIYQPGGLGVLANTALPAFADGTIQPMPSFEMPSLASGDGALAPGTERLLRALLMQVQAGNKQAMDDAQTGHEIARGIRTNVGPGISAPARRAVG